MRKSSIAALFLLFLCIPGSAWAQCSGNFLNPITSLQWRCLFPMSLAGIINLNYGDQPEDEDRISSPVCACKAGVIWRVGLNFSFWNPSRMVETVKDPYCFPGTGMDLPNPVPGSLGGAKSTPAGGSALFAQSHYYIYPVWAVLDMFVDVPCLENKGFDLAMMTEVLPTWNDPVMAMLINPEAILFANPAAQFTCMADAAAVAVGLPLNELFWCQGSWSGTYPMTGHVNGSDQVEGNAAVVGRTIYMLARNGLIRDHGVDACGTVKTTIWKKRNYRFQMMHPVKDSNCQPPGKPGVLWTSMKNTMTGGDNFAWMLFRRVKCCYTFY